MLKRICQQQLSFRLLRSSFLPAARRFSDKINVDEVLNSLNDDQKQAVDLKLQAMMAEMQAMKARMNELETKSSPPKKMTEEDGGKTQKVKELFNMLKAFDQDGDNMLQYGEFRDMAVKLRLPPHRTERLKEKYFPTRDEDLTLDVFTELFNEMASDGDGANPTLSHSDFMRMAGVFC